VLEVFKADRVLFGRVHIIEPEGDDLGIKIVTLEQDGRHDELDGGMGIEVRRSEHARKSRTCCVRKAHPSARDAGLGCPNEWRDRSGIASWRLGLADLPAQNRAGNFLEIKLCAELNGAAAGLAGCTTAACARSSAVGGEDAAEVWIVDQAVYASAFILVIDDRELGVIERVVGLDPEFKKALFRTAQVHALSQRQVGVVDTRPVEEVAAGIAELADRLEREIVGIEVVIILSARSRRRDGIHQARVARIQDLRRGGHIGRVPAAVLLQRAALE